MLLPIPVRKLTVVFLWLSMTPPVGLALAAPAGTAQFAPTPRRSNPSGRVFFSISAIRPRVAGVHITSLNHARTCRSMGSPTVSKTLVWRHMDQERIA